MIRTIETGSDNNAQRIPIYAPFPQTTTIEAYPDKGIGLCHSNYIMPIENSLYSSHHPQNAQK